jgi:hypothetical protein
MGNLAGIVGRPWQEQVCVAALHTQKMVGTGKFELHWLLRSHPSHVFFFKTHSLRECGTLGCPRSATRQK